MSSLLIFTWLILIFLIPNYQCSCKQLPHWKHLKTLGQFLKIGYNKINSYLNLENPVLNQKTIADMRR